MLPALRTTSRRSPATAPVALALVVTLVLALVPSSASAKGDPKLLAKRDTIVAFFNLRAQNVETAMRNYFESKKRADGTFGPNCKSPGTSTESLDKAPSEVSELRRLAKSKPAVAKLDAATREMADAYEALSLTFDASREFYKGYRPLTETQCRDAQAAHDRVKAAGARFRAAQHAVYEWLRADQKQRAEGELKEIEKASGKKARYHLKKSLFEAEDMLQKLEAAETKKDASLASSAVSAYEPIATALADFEKQNHTKADQYGYSDFASRMKSFLERAKRHVERIKAGKEGDLRNVVAEYNSAVGTANRINFSSEFR